MSVDNYLRKVGALTPYKRSDILSGLALICFELFSPEDVQEPDCVQWTQESPYTEEDNFNLRCDFILYGTSGNVTDLLATARKSPTFICEEAIEQLLKIRLFNYALYLYFQVNKEEGKAPWDQDFNDPKWNLSLWNDFLEFEGEEEFSSWGEVLNVYKDGTLTESGISAVAEFLSLPPQRYSYRGHPEILYPGGVIPDNVRKLLCLD